MRIVFFGNNWIGWQISQWLQGQGDEIVALVLHPSNRSKYREEIIESAGLDPEFIFDGSKLRDPVTLKAIQETGPDIGVSAAFGYILNTECLNIIPSGCVNVHSSLLPYNRGAYPNVWSIVDRTPSGVTLHYMDDGVDTGDIVAQREIKVEPVDTGASLYRKLEFASVELFKENWKSLQEGSAQRISQRGKSGTFHRVRDIEELDEIDLDKSYIARELIDLIRARTFKPHHGTYFYDEGKKVYLYLDMAYEE